MGLNAFVIKGFNTSNYDCDIYFWGYLEMSSMLLVLRFDLVYFSRWSYKLESGREVFHRVPVFYRRNMYV